MRRDLQTNEKKNDFIRHEACPACRKVGADTDGDNLARYSDGSAYCFKCKFSEQGFSTVVSLSKPISKSVNFIEGEYKDLQKRKITAETCKKFHYQLYLLWGTLSQQTYSVK